MAALIDLAWRLLQSGNTVRLQIGTGSTLGKARNATTTRYNLRLK
jgi:hypothetical protein